MFVLKCLNASFRHFFFNQFISLIVFLQPYCKEVIHFFMENTQQNVLTKIEQKWRNKEQAIDEYRELRGVMWALKKLVNTNETKVKKVALEIFYNITYPYPRIFGKISTYIPTPLNFQKPVCFNVNRSIQQMQFHIILFLQSFCFAVLKGLS